MQQMWVRSLGQGDPWSRKWLLTPVFLAGEFHGQRSLAGHKELDTTERLSMHASNYMQKKQNQTLI